MRFSLLALGLFTSALRAQGVVTGTVFNAVSHEPVRLAVVRQAGSGVSTLSDDRGRYRMQLPLGEQRLDVRRVGYRPTVVAVIVGDSGTRLDITLDPLPVNLGRMVATSEDDFARHLVVAAIARKHELRGSVHDYRYRGDVRLVVSNLKKPADSASSVMLITESQTAAYWEQPSHYQETILARRQTGNLPAARNLVGVGQILNFGAERLTLASFELPSPIADDALDVYDYRVLDTLAVDGRRAYRLSVEPKPNGAPAFVGVIDILDSTFDVSGIDVGVNSAVRFGPVRDLRYQQRFREMAGGHWMPHTIEFTADVDLGALGRFGLRHEAFLSDFRFNEGQRPVGLDEYRIVVDRGADRPPPDSLAWAHAQVAPLTPAESLAWHRIDSVALLPRSALRAAAVRVVSLAAGAGPDLFHFNRVDGAYIGVGGTASDPDDLGGNVPTAKVGYATGSQLWQYRAGDRLRLSEEQRMWIGATYHDETMARPTLTSSGYEPTLRSLFTTADPLEYYRERGGSASFSTKLVNFTTLQFGYLDAIQSSLVTTVTRPPLTFHGARDTVVFRPNQPIDDGHLRAFSGGLSFDSRPWLREQGRDFRLGAFEFTQLRLDAEWSPPAISGFDYTRLMMRADRRQRTLGMGVTSFTVAAGLASRAVPLQRAFTIDGGAQVLETQASPFSTLRDSSFTGSRTALVAVEHNFDRLLFTKSRIPLVRDIPFTVSVRAAAFWADLPLGGLDSAFVARRVGLDVTRDAYREVGFTLGNLTPFLPIFDFSIRFAWQLSHYDVSPDSRRFRVSIGLAP